MTKFRKGSIIIFHEKLYRVQKVWYDEAHKQEVMNIYDLNNNYSGVNYSGVLFTSWKKSITLLSIKHYHSLLWESSRKEIWSCTGAISTPLVEILQINYLLNPILACTRLTNHCNTRYLLFTQWLPHLAWNTTTLPLTPPYSPGYYPLKRILNYYFTY